MTLPVIYSVLFVQSVHVNETDFELLTTTTSGACGWSETAAAMTNTTTTIGTAIETIRFLLIFSLTTNQYSPS
jgi:hypothetical protein